jgi:class 3 adenylate cyclase/tetratricopeptide (TPR) repeat protein
VTVADIELRALEEQGEVLKPYVPRLQIAWLRENPQSTHRSGEASLAFVDISGFTALTESLNRRGKIGAELLRDTLNPIFSDLLEVAYRWGAGLLKWGGDAMLLHFDGAGHEHRAARAAWEMQKTIERVGRVRVGSTRVRLSMSVGIATGPVDLFVAGSVHRELLVVGPTATETAVIEGAVDAGEIGVSPALAERLASSCIGAPKGPAFLLVAPPDAAERRTPDVGRVSGLDIASCIPIAAREHVLLERSEPEHRAVTAVFFDLMHTDSLLAELGPVEFAKALEERISSIQEAAASYGVPFNVSDVSKESVKVLLTAGAPSTTGHDEEQTLRLVREVMDRPGVIPMRAGLDAGHVFTGDFGPPYRRTYAVLGDAINTAARVMARAEPGQILATDVVLERSRTTFETTPIEPFAAKGKAEPVRAALVGAIAGRRAHRIADTPFVGRERELQALLNVLDEVRRRDSWVVEIAGPSGIGKTRLVREALAATPEIRVFRATCEQYEASTPYHVLRGLLRESLGLPPGNSPAHTEWVLRDVVAAADLELVPWIPLLGLPLGLELPPTPETEALDERFLRETLADVTSRLLAARFDATPFALVVEDAQFIDDSSADLLRRVARAGGRLPHALVIVRTQPEGLWTDVEDEDVRFLAFDLLPLSEREAAEIVEITTDEQPLRPHEIEELAHRSGGSPLFLVELLNVARGAGTTDGLPDSVEAVVTADIDRLSAADRVVLRYASVLGVSFDEDMLVATLGDDVAPEAALWERLRGLVDRDADGRLHFRNTLVHAVAYEGLPFRRRRELHARVGLELESRFGGDSGDEAGVLAAHFFHAADRDRAWRYSRLAGDHAKGIYANVDAASLYMQALQTARRFRGATGSEIGAVAESLGDVRYRLGEFEDAGEAYRLAVRHTAGDRIEGARLLLKQALIPWRLGRYPQALARVTRGLRLIEGLNDQAAVRERANLFARKAVIKQQQGRALEAIEWCRRTIEAADGSGTREALAQAQYVLDWAYASLGRFDEAVYSERALAIYVELGNLERQGAILNNLGAIAYYQAKWTEAVGFYERAQQVWERSGDRWSASFAVVNRAEVLLDQGRLSEAEPLIRESLRVARASRFGTQLAETARYTGMLLARLGRFEEARRLLDEAHDEFERVGESSEVLVTEARLGESLVLERSSSAALDLAERTLARLSAFEGIFPLGPTLHRVRGLALLQLDRFDEARAALNESLEGAKSAGADYEVALALDALAVLARLEGESVKTVERERDAIFARLGVVATPEIPLPPDEREL